MTSDDTLQEAAAAIEATKARIAAVPAEVVVVNHAMGLYELAAIHLTAEPPRLGDAALAIDALTGLVETVGARLGEDGTTLGEALSNIRLAFVQIKAAQQGG